MTHGYIFYLINWCNCYFSPLVMFRKRTAFLQKKKQHKRALCLKLTLRYNVLNAAWTPGVSFVLVESFLVPTDYGGMHFFNVENKPN